MTDTASPASDHRAKCRHHGDAGEPFVIMPVNIARIAQCAAAASTTGEGLAEVRGEF